MIKNTSNASVQQIIFVSYVLITVPALLISYLVIESIDEEFRIHAKYVLSGEVDHISTTQNQFIRFGTFLRERSFPFTEIENSLAYKNNVEFGTWSAHLTSLRAAIIYSLTVIFISSLLVYITLGISLKKVFQGLSLAIDKLGDHELTEEINIDSRFDVQDLSNSLENLRQQMNNDEQEQQRYLRHISHEIKTPLTSIKEGSMLLNQQIMGTMNDDQQEVTSILVRSSVELQRAVENLLDYNAAIRFKDYSSRTQINLASLVEQALQNNELAIKQRNLTVNLKLDQCESFVDRRQVTSVFDNLISNAVKHSPVEGDISISLFCNQSGFHCFEIADKGQGVRDYDKDYIFDPFYVGSQQTETTLKGTGLGLSIAKQYIEDHKGDLRLIDSERGAVFQATIPSVKASHDNKKSKQ